MAYAAVTFLLENLKLVLSRHASLISHPDSEIDLLQEDLTRLKGSLEDAYGRRKNDHFCILESKVKEAIKEVEEIIDSSITEAAEMSRSKNLVRRALKSSGRLQAPSFGDCKLKNLADEVQKELQNLPAADDSISSRTPPTNKASRHGSAVGLEDEIERLVNDLNRESDKLEVISITGLPGIGKTTLAGRIFQDQRIRYEFPVCIWIYVSPELTVKEIFLAILEKFTHQDMSSKSAEELMPIVSEYLRLGKFLIVMEDLETTTGAWAKFQQVLPRSNNLSKVLITTRNRDVAQATCLSPHEKMSLTREQSWELLQVLVFGSSSTSNCPPELEEVGITIADACNGNPLSVVVIGGILVEKLPSETSEDVKKEWQEVYTSGLINDKGLENIISQSYATLPPDMNDCFLYLGMFPQGAEIPVKTLTWLWCAEGLISEPTKSIEETAESYLEVLIGRNLLMVDKTKINGEVKSCRVHNKVREFCKAKADVDEQNLFKEIRRFPGSSEPDLHNCRRLCIHSSIHDFLSREPKVPKARSFLCFSRSPVFLETKDSSRFTDAFSLVRVLDTNTIKLPKYPTKIANLIHLRYLTLSVEELKILPETVSNLWNLETLVVSTSSDTLEIKTDIWKMMRLRHLKTKSSIILKNKTTGDGGEYLQTLAKLSPQSSTDAVFQKAKYLKKLGIHGNLLRLSDSISMAMLLRLEKLTLEHDIPRLHHEKSLLRLPQPDRFPPNLKFLVLSGTYLEWQQMSTVSELAKLEVLKLKNNAFTGECWDVANGGFKCLEALSISQANLKYWTASSDSFPKLKNLELRNCEKLQEVPSDLGKNTLEKFSMYRITRYAVSSAMEIQQDRDRKSATAFKLIVAPGDM